MTQKIKTNRKLLVKDLNPFITCTLCEGYFVDATTLVECLHTFCRGCILKNFENKLCPICNTDYKKKNQCLRPDPQIQTLVFKLIPSLYSKEIQRREDFYRSTTVRASSSCSDDSVIERERNLIGNNEDEDSIMKQVGERTKFLGAEDLISLSLEYYQLHLDKTDVKSDGTKKLETSDVAKSDKNSTKDDKTGVEQKSDGAEHKKNGQNGDSDQIPNGDSDCKTKDSDKRFLSCPAAVSMKHLQKFVRMKYALTADHRVDIIYKGEVLPDTYSLMDVAYIFDWHRAKPMRFFYRIFTPMKVRPIKIVNTTLSTGGKQLQIVPIKPNSDQKTAQEKTTTLTQKELDLEEEERRSRKEELLAHLQLQSKSKTLSTQEGKKTANSLKIIQDCVFDYNETEEEIKKFAENRDREWAMQKKLDESRTKVDDSYHHISKKRKKNKHSKSEFIHKKRKLHAEKITTDEAADLLKLKVKLTNGHKHKHHKSTDKNSNNPELSQKEKLLQMRQVRHKQQAAEEKVVVANTPKAAVEKIETPPPPVDTSKKQQELKVELSRVPNEVKPKIKPVNNVWTQPKKLPVLTETEKKAQNTFLKTFQSYTEKYQKNNEKILQNQKDSQKIPKPNLINTNNKILDQKLANLQQRCTIEPKKVGFDKSTLLNSGYHSGFTVSKIESGTKRKAEDDKEIQDKRPSLEITLINPTTPVVNTSPNTDKNVIKRPPPATIPLDRIKKSVNLKSAGLSIIPKIPEKCDNIGALDLSKHNKEQAKTELPNGTKPPARPEIKNNIQLSNLQMLSKVATEQNTFSKPPPTPNNKVRQQMPNLQTLKIPNMLKMPKLNELKFRPQHPQMRNIRPNQNQNIRNIPNPSLLIKQQNQNRMNSFNTSQQQQQQQQNSVEKKASEVVKTVKETVARAVPVSVDSKICEKNEISV